MEAALDAGAEPLSDENGLRGRAGRVGELAVVLGLVDVAVAPCWIGSIPISVENRRGEGGSYMGNQETKR